MSRQSLTTLAPALARLPSVAIVRVTLVATVAVIPLLLSPWWIARSDAETGGIGFLSSLFYVLAIVATSRGLSRIELPVERRFWSLLTAAVTCRLIAELFTALASTLGASGPGVAVELLHAAGYTLLLIALEQRPHRLPRRESGAGEKTLSPLLLVLLVGSYLLYFPLLPLFSPHAHPAPQARSLAFHLVLELLVTGWLASLYYRAKLPRWRGIYGLLLIGSALSVVQQLVGPAMLHWSYSLPPLAETLPALALPICLVLAAALRALPFAVAAETSTETELPLEIPTHIGLKTLYFAIAFPCLHIILYSFGLLDEWLRTSRELVVALCLPPLALLALQRHLALRRYSRQQMERRSRLSSALQQSQANLRLLHQKQEAALDQRRAEERFSTFFRMSPTGLLIADLSEGQVEEVNTSFAQLLGRDSDELVGLSLTELGLWHDDDFAIELLAKVAGGDSVHRQRVRLRTHLGWREVLLSATSLELGRTDGLLMVVRDIDDQRRAAAHLAQRQRWRELAESESRRLTARENANEPSGTRAANE